ncbi:MAG: hypothetical protein J5537_00170 [Lachnospiraceae bacterium]|nr:hypothetical protein [Lachnospiraceae bacterium]
MYKKFLVIPAFILALGLVGCSFPGGNEAKEPAKETATEATQETKTETVAEPKTETTAEPADNAADGDASAEITDKENAEGETIIEISWDFAEVKYDGDPYQYQEGTDGPVMPHLFIEGDDVEILEETTEGTIKTTKIAVKNPDKYARIMVEPGAPTNSCPLDTVTAKITHPDGKEETLNPDTSLVRGQTGIWYFDVYEQGSDQ